MAEADEGHLQVQQLTATAQKAAEDCRDFLRSANYRPQGNYEICDDSLKQQCGSFYALFAPLVKSGSELRLTALRFLKRATLPLKEGASVYLVPVIISGEATVANKAVEMGRYLHLTKDVTVEPELYCLAILAK